MSRIPRDPAPDSTLALLSEGYLFISNRCRRHGTDLFATRLMLRPAVCARGADAARMFYAPDRFTRRGAMPVTTLKLLQDRGSVQMLDGDAHRARKRMFMSMMTPESIDRLAGAMAARWRMALPRWGGMDRVVLHEEVRGILCRAACDWAGIPLAADEAPRRTAELGMMIDCAGSVGPQAWRAIARRRGTERWLRDLVVRIRAGTLHAPEGSPARIIADHRGDDGRTLDPEVAAVELLNLLRPTVAIARFVTFAALALHRHPEWRQALAADGPDGAAVEPFVQEVRRFYPFFPFIAGRVRTPFDWQGHDFGAGDWVLLDLYGTNHDPRIWGDPDAFRPDRFRARDTGAYDFVPQGGGGFEAGHRCPGEWITIALMKTAVGLLATEMAYDVPDQDLRVDLSRMPALPASRFVIAAVRAT